MSIYFESWLEKNMVCIPAGTYTKGGKCRGRVCELDSEGYLSEMTLSKSFLFSKYVITQAVWESVMGTTPWDNLFIQDKAPNRTQEDVDFYKEIFRSGDNFPAVGINWYEAQEFCKILSEKTGKKYRLPTDTEWEYVAKDNQETDYYGFNHAVYRKNRDFYKKKIAEYAWLSMNLDEEKFLHEVGLLKPNNFGVYDIQGNTREWVLDKAYLQENSVHIRKDHYPEAATDWYSADGDYPFARGGIYHSVLGFTYFSLAGSINPPDFQSPSVGFRIVQEIDT